MSRRTLRVNDLLREEIADILRRDIQDPRLETLVSITEVDMSQDMRHAKVHVSIYGSDEERAAAFKALINARNFIQRQLRRRLPDLRLIPELSFRRDDSMERGARLTEILDTIKQEDGVAAATPTAVSEAAPEITSAEREA